MEPKSQRTGLPLIVAAALIWSTGGCFIKYIPLEPALIASSRAFIAGLTLLPFLRPSKLKATWEVPALLASYVVMSTCFVIANKWTTAANAIAIQYTAPLWIFAASLAFGHLVLTWRRAAPMAVIAAGIVLFVLEPATGPSSFAGNMVALVSGVGFALVTIFFRRLRALHGPSLVCLCNLCTGVGAAPLVHDYSAIWGLTFAGWAALLFLGSIQIGVAYILYAAGLQRVRPLRAATVSLIEPILNPLLVFLLLHEVPSHFGIAGAVAILVGIVMDLKLNAGEDVT